MSKGSLKIQVFEGSTYIPLENAQITITQVKQAGTRKTTESIFTDSSGLTKEIELDAPKKDYSMELSSNLPYSLCDIVVEVPGYRKLYINGCQIFPDTTSIQECNLYPISEKRSDEDIVNTLPNTLIGNYEAKIPESSTPEANTSLSKQKQDFYFFITTNNQVIPKSIAVHLGKLNNLSAQNYGVDYKDYIKNVAACEIFPTWPTEAIKANVYAIISFTLNRVFTEWYLGKGFKNFNITNSTALDQSFNKGRGTFVNVNQIVDEIFSTYIKKPNYEFPLLAQFCDGIKIKAKPGIMSQWGSKALADKGMKALEILKYYYGSDKSLQTIERMEDIKESYPGSPLQVNSKGEPVKVVQKILNVVSKNYPLINKVPEDGIFSNETKKSVETFQGIFSLRKTGIVDYATWYKLSDVYVAIVNKNSRNYRLIKRTLIPPFINRCIYDVPKVTYFDDEE